GLARAHLQFDREPVFTTSPGAIRDAPCEPGASAVSPERQVGSFPHRHALWGRGGAPRAHTWLWAVAALAYVFTLNPVTAERYARSHYVAPWAAALLWVMDLLVLLIGALWVRGHRKHVGAAGPQLRTLAVGLLLAALCLEGLLRIFPAVALPASLERERSWRADPSTPGSWATARGDMDEVSPAVGWPARPNL